MAKKKLARKPAMRKKTAAARTKSGTSQLFRGIRLAYTLSGAATKAARNTLPADLSVQVNLAMIEEHGRIKWIGPEKKLTREQKSSIKRDTNLHGATIMPAFVESHTHLIYAGTRAAEFERRNNGETYQSIAASGGGILSTVGATQKASEIELLKIAQARANRFVRQGVTTIEIKSGYGLTVQDELKMLKSAKRIEGARISGTFLGAHAIPKEFANDEAYVDFLVREALPKLKGLASRVDIFVEKGYFGEKAARAYLEGARQHGLGIAIHADQLNRTGASRLAIEFEALSAEHLVQINDADVDALSASEVTCVCLPTSDLYMKCAYPPARKLIDKGARVALATDFNPGTAPSQDLALTGLLARLEMKMTLPEVAVAYTLGGAHALGLQKDLGSLEVGKFCDFVVLESDLEALFYEAGRQPIARVFREGKELQQS